MNIHVYDRPEQAGQAAALLIAAQLLRKPHSVLGLATGSSPIPIYRSLIVLYQAGVISFDRVVSYNLDEYVGIDPDHVCSYHRFMREQLFDHVNMRPEAIHVPDGKAADLAAAASAYDRAIETAGGIDLQLLGIGRNGHIGFNEPNSHFVGGCHVTDLTASTIEANQRFFDSIDNVPRQAVSLGITPIMRAKTVVLIATGADKAQAVKAAVRGPVDPRVQASILQAHPDAHFMLDQEAAALL
ncbi:MAG: glucosamine-6-phosphate deaminase [Clostridia bacterium]|nr:glucosamine-6-phosphate deaminase [Clostridia bacterium]